MVDELIERTEMELDYRLEADNQRTFAKAYNGDAHFVVPHVVASAPKVMVTEWIEGVPLAASSAAAPPTSGTSAAQGFRVDLRCAGGPG